MRVESTSQSIHHFMREFGLRANKPIRVYLTGGATCVLNGWRNSTIDIDIKPIPDFGEVYQIIADLKEELSLNIELASPDHWLTSPTRVGRSK